MNTQGKGKAQQVVTPAAGRTFQSLLGYTEEELAAVDPLEMNLLVARAIPSLAGLDIASYRRTADTWAQDIKGGLRRAEAEFHKTPHDWKNDLAFFRLGYLCYYVDEQLGVRYREDQKELTAVRYTDPNDLFLNGVMDSRRGTCANMAALHVALGWRLRWPVSLACVASHKICRYDDGQVRHNIEATKSGLGGFQSHPDDYYLRYYHLPAKAVSCGSDLRALRPTELLGVFVGLRARHFADTQRLDEAERDYLLARALFPQSRYLFNAQMELSLQEGPDLFEPFERGHPTDLARLLQDVVAAAAWEANNSQQKEAGRESNRYTYDYACRQN